MTLCESTIPSFSTSSSTREWTRLIKTYARLQLKDYALPYYGPRLLGRLWVQGDTRVALEVGKVYISAMVYMAEHAWAHSLHEIHLIVLTGLSLALGVSPGQVASDMEEALGMEEISQQMHHHDQRAAARAPAGVG